MAHTRNITGNRLAPSSFPAWFLFNSGHQSSLQELKNTTGQITSCLTFFFVNHFKKKDAWTQNMKNCFSIEFWSCKRHSHRNVKISFLFLCFLQKNLKILSKDHLYTARPYHFTCEFFLRIMKFSRNRHKVNIRLWVQCLCLRTVL